MRDELGLPFEERMGDAECRFFAPADLETMRRSRARALLEQIDALPEGVHVVEVGSVRYVCDPDPVTPERAHRFLDASTAVSR